MKSPRFGRDLVWLAVLAALSCSFPLLASQSPFYDFKSVAQTGRSYGGFDVQAIKPSVSINHQGHVAFVAAGASGDGLFR